MVQDESNIKQCRSGSGAFFFLSSVDGGGTRFQDTANLARGALAPSKLARRLLTHAPRSIVI
jgi:hypothetical protein